MSFESCTCVKTDNTSKISWRFAAKTVNRRKGLKRQESELVFFPNETIDGKSRARVGIYNRETLMEKKKHKRENRTIYDVLDYRHSRRS